MFVYLRKKRKTVIAKAVDLYFKSVALLFNGDFLRNSDKSVLGPLHYVQGSTKVTNMAPFYGDGYYSVKFDKNSSSRVICNYTSGSPLDIRSGDFTVEFWFFADRADNGTTPVTILSNGLQPSVDAFSIRLYATTTDISSLNIFATTDTGTTPFGATGYTATASIKLREWHHVAIVRNGNNIKVFQDGLIVINIALSVTIRQGSAWLFGSSIQGSNNYFSGYLSNVRIVKGSALYTDSFNPSATPLTPIAGTSFLGLMSSRFVDLSPNKNYIAPFSSPTTSTISQNNPFAFKDMLAGLYFSTNNYLTFPASVNYLLPGDFTLEGWYHTSTGSVTLYDTAGDGSNDTLTVANIGASNGTISWAGQIIASGLTTPVYEWTHVAVSRTGSTIYAFLNGKLVGTINYAAPIGASDQTLYIGRSSDGTKTSQANLSNIRLVKGIGLYTSDFVPSEVQLTAIDGTVLLTCQGTWKDNSVYNAVPTAVNGFVSGQKYLSPFKEKDLDFKESSGSISFNGSTDYTQVSNGALPFIGTNDFTIEVMFLATTLGTGAVLFSKGPGLQVSVSTSGITVSLSSNNSSTYFINTLFGAVTSGQWHHFSLVKSGQNYYASLNGTVTLLGTSALNVDTGNSYWRFASSSSSTLFFSGLLNNFRYNDNIALYTANFTPPSSDLTADANTKLLTFQSNVPFNGKTINDRSPVRTAITMSGNVGQSSFTPYNPKGWSTAFPGTISDYVTVAASLNWTFQGDHTIEAWVYPLVAGQEMHVFGTGTTVTANDRFSFVAGNGNGSLTYAYNVVGNKAMVTNAVIPVNTWTHLAVTRSGNTLKGFINGVEVYSGTLTISVGGNAIAYIGKRSDNTCLMKGFISNLRVINGTSIYNGTFTPSKTDLSVTADTKLLTFKTYRYFDESAAASVMTAFGNTSIRAGSPFSYDVVYDPDVHGTSLLFSGTLSDYLSYSSGNESTITDDYTVDVWVYPLSSSGNMTIYTFGSQSTDTFTILARDGTGIVMFGSATAQVTTGKIPLNAWTHLSAVKTGGNLKLFINGAQAYSGSLSTVGQYNANCNIGRNSTTNYFNGYIFDLRVVKGSALHFNKFNLPTERYKTRPDSILHIDGRTNAFVDYSCNSAVTSSGSNAVKSYSSHDGNGSIYFDSTSDVKLSPTPTAHLAADFTFEAWVNPSVSTEVALLTIGSEASGRVRFAIQAGVKIVYEVFGGSPVNFTSLSPALSTWSHVAIVRKNGVVRAYVNGQESVVSVANSNLDSTYCGNSGGITIGSNNGSNYFGGLMDDIELTKYARYNGPFTPPQKLFLS